MNFDRDDDDEEARSPFTRGAVPPKPAHSHAWPSAKRPSLLDNYWYPLGEAPAESTFAEGHFEHVYPALIELLSRYPDVSVCVEFGDLFDDKTRSIYRGATLTLPAQALKALELAVAQARSAPTSGGYEAHVVPSLQAQVQALERDARHARDVSARLKEELTSARTLLMQATRHAEALAARVEDLEGREHWLQAERSRLEKALAERSPPATSTQVAARFKDL